MNGVVTPGIVSSVSRVALAASFPAFQVARRWTFQKGQFRFVIPVSGDNGESYLLIDVESGDFGSWAPSALVRKGKANNERARTEVHLSDEEVECLRFFVSVQSNTHDVLGVRGVLPKNAGDVTSFLLKLRERPDWDELVKRAGVTEAQLKCAEMSLDIARPLAQREELVNQFIAQFMQNVRRDEKSRLWEPAVADRGIGFAWKLITRKDLDLNQTTGSAPTVSTLELITHYLNEWRKLTPAVEYYCRSQDAGEDSFAQKVTRMVTRSSSIPMIQFQEDLYLFENVAVNREQEFPIEEIKFSIYPYWYCLQPRPDPAAIKDSELFKFLTAQGWTPHTMWALFALWGVALVSSPEFSLNLQLSPYLLGQQSTGKSTLAGCIKRCFNRDNIAYISKTDTSNFRTSRFADARLIHWGETGPDTFDNQSLKALSSGDTLFACTKYEHSRAFEFKGLLLLDGNEPFFKAPSTTTPDGTPNPTFEAEMTTLRALARRFVIFPFEHAVAKLVNADELLAAETPVHISTALYCVHQMMREPDFETRKAVFCSSPQIDEYREMRYNPFIPDPLNPGVVRRLSLQPIVRRPDSYESPFLDLSVFTV